MEESKKSLESKNEEEASRKDKIMAKKIRKGNEEINTDNISQRKEMRAQKALVEVETNKL